MNKLQPFIPGIALFIIAFLIGLATYQDYGMAWDEPGQRYTGQLNYNYAFHGKDDLFTTATDYHGPAFEMVLLGIEDIGHITDPRDIYLSRHLATHIFFLIAVLCGYVLCYRLFGNRLVATIGALALLLAPRLYAHSFFNSKDIPFMGMVVIVFMLFEAAFRRQRWGLFVALGLACGYTTGIRVMGVLYMGLILLFLAIDAVTAIAQRRSANKPLLHVIMFFVAYCVALCLSWPYLWRTPVYNFMVTFSSMTHYAWEGSLLFRGNIIPGTALPWIYFPVWFVLTTPLLWLAAGGAGIIWVIIAGCRAPLAFISNSRERNFLFYLVSFAAPVVLVIGFRAVIYDDWRHLYFVYPPFVLLGLWAINKALDSKYSRLVVAACVVQVASSAIIICRIHPFEQVYFNPLASYQEESLRKNYELEYWGCGFMQALDTLVARQPYGTISVSSNQAGHFPLANNVLMLKAEDRDRIQYHRNPQEADHMITNFRLSADDPVYPHMEYARRYHGSTILCIYKTH